MLKFLPLLLFLALTAPDCGKKRPVPPVPQPTPIATPSPDSAPTPSPSPSATLIGKPAPYPVPAVNVAPYLHEQGGRVVQVDTSGAEDAGVVINAADGFEGSGKLIISGGGKIKTQVVLKHDSVWQGEYFCDVETWEGCILLRDNTRMEGGTFHEPTGIFDNIPSITVIQTYASAKNNYASCESVTVKGVTILGRQTKTDGGVRQAISFGNCKNCAAIENDLSGIASIGIQFGGGAAEQNHAVNVLAYRNKLRRFAAAAIALVNVDGAVVAENDIRDPGRKPCWTDPNDPSKRICEPGGNSGIDIESNNTDDCVKDLKIFNNYIGYGTAAFQSIGNGILGQNVYGTPCSGGLLIANNVIDGHEGRNGLEASNNWGLSGGLYFVGQWHGGLVVNNVITRALQAGISCYGCRGLTFQDTWLVSTGGGGMGAVYMEGSSGNTFNRVRIFDDPKITPGSTGWWIECDASSGVNTFEDVQLEGKILCKQ